MDRGAPDPLRLGGRVASKAPGRLPVHGGPLDGLHGGAKPVGGFIKYLDESGHPYDENGRDRWPYRRLSTHWEFAGFTHRQCGGCGAWVERDPDGAMERCLCGKEKAA